MSAIAYDLRRTSGYLVADVRGRVVGRVDSPMYGTRPDEPDAIAVRSGWLSRRRRLVPAEAIQQIDRASGVIGLRVERELLRAFL
ncbi:MAG TPA: PH domain-containing protein [Gaiellaceae bacterium]|nr:PH domain-containing protein [Gaiellaceae bacterium]